MMAAVNQAKHLQNEMWQQTVLLVPQNLNEVTPTVVEPVGQLSDLIEQRLVAAEEHIPDAIWLVFILISVLTCFVGTACGAGYCWHARFTAHGRNRTLAGF